MEHQEKSKNAIMAGENETYLIHGNIIYVVAIGEQTAEVAIKQLEIVAILASQINGKINYLIDINRSRKNSPEARQTWKDISDDDRTDRVGLFGMHPVAKVLASFVMGIVRKNNQRFFSTKEEAMAYLQQGESWIK